MIKFILACVISGSVGALIARYLYLVWIEHKEIAAEELEEESYASLWDE